MTSDMAVELRSHGVRAVSLYPGLVRTEKVMQAAAWLDLNNSESPEFIGRAVAALAQDPDVIRHSGAVLVAAKIAREYGFTDIDGKTPRPLTLADVSTCDPPDAKKRFGRRLPSCSSLCYAQGPFRIGPHERCGKRGHRRNMEMASCSIHPSAREEE